MVRVSSPPQSRSKAVVCVSTPRMYPRSRYFLVISNHILTHVLDLKAGFGLQNVSVTYIFTPVLITLHILNQNDASKLAFLKQTDQRPVQGRQKFWNIGVKDNSKYLKCVQKCWCGSCYNCHPTSNSPVVYSYFREYVRNRDLRKVLNIYNDKNWNVKSLNFDIYHLEVWFVNGKKISLNAKIQK